MRLPLSARLNSLLFLSSHDILPWLGDSLEDVIVYCAYEISDDLDEEMTQKNPELLSLAAIRN